MNANKRATPPDFVDPDDAPELTDEFFEQADEFVGDRLARRGRGRPRSATPKLLVTIRYDEEVIAAFRATGSGWQTRMNAILREAVEQGRVKADS